MEVREQIKKNKSKNHFESHDAKYPEDPLMKLLDGRKKSVFISSDKNLDVVEDQVHDLGEIADAMGQELKEHQERLKMLAKTNKEANVNADDLDAEVDALLRRYRS